MTGQQHLILTTCFLIFAAPVSAAVLTVGGDSDCQFNSIQAAISAAETIDT